MGGLWAAVPRLAGVAMIFALASLGLPGLGNFVSEILILFGTYRVSVPAAVLATLGLISATIYALWMIQAAFHGPDKEGWKLPDLSGREAAVMGAMIAVILWLGLYPQPVFKTTTPALHHLEQTATGEQIAARPPSKAIVLSEMGRRPSAPSVWPKGGDP
jgi:NADH-quinone oxidoreductase subunit M